MPVSLANLLRIGQLKEHPREPGEIARLLAAAERGIADASVAACVEAAEKLLRDANARLGRRE
jgi:hypothetical protein